MKLFSLILTLAPMALAQLPAGNAAGVAMGHLHLNVKDVDESKKFWVDQLGGTPVKMGPMEVLKFPGALVILKKADPTGGTEGSTVNHIGFLVRDLDKQADQGAKHAEADDHGRPDPGLADVLAVAW